MRDVFVEPGVGGLWYSGMSIRDCSLNLEEVKSRPLVEYSRLYYTALPEPVSSLTQLFE